MKSLVLLLSAFCALTTAAQDGRIAGPIKEWRVPLQHGEARIALEHGPGDRLVLGIVGPPCVPCTTIAEISSAIATVIKQLPALGLDPARITLVTMQIDEIDVRDRLVAAALQSRSWKACMKIPACGGNEQIVQLLNDSHAYAPLANSFSQGRSIRVLSAEKITVKRVSQLSPSPALPGVNPALKVPTNGHLELGFTESPQKDSPRR